MDNQLPDREMRHRPEEYEETVDPQNPPSAAVPAMAVPTMWYYLGPIVLILLVAGLAIFLWARDDRNAPDELVPTTGTYQEDTPGGRSPDPRPRNSQQEEEFRGGAPADAR